MHKQCAELYIKNTGKYCSICGGKFRTFLLQNIPKLTMSEREHLKIQKTKHEDFIQHEKRCINSWSNYFFPKIVGFYHKNGIRPRDVQLCLINITEDSVNNNSFIQYNMDKGMKREDVDICLLKIKDITNSYEYMDRRIKKVLTNNFKRSNYTFVYPESDIE